jgi:hypothetical protein
MATTTMATPAQVLPRVPVTLLMKPGELRLAEGRLTFRVGADEPVLDAPVAELHSVALAVTGMHVWHGPRQWRFVFPRAVTTAPGRAQARRDPPNDTAARWVDVLQPIVGDPPVGVRVGAPWPRWAWTAGLVLTVAVIVAIVLLLSRFAQ